MEPTVWLTFFVILLLFEAVTPGLTTIWFAAGTLAAYLFSVADGSRSLQIGAFLFVTIVMSILLRPLAKKWKNSPGIKTNAESLIGKTVRIVQTINNYEETGAAILNGQEWTARSMQEDTIIPEGACGIVREICGVKLMIDQIEETE